MTKLAAHRNGGRTNFISFASAWDRFSGSKRTVIDGPFAETKELIAGFWLWQVRSKEEAIEWVKRAPNPMPGTESEIEIRQVFEAEDFGAEFTPELREQEERLRAELDAKQKKG